MTGPVEVAIVGAGPYGLSLGAHLRAAGIRFRHFGRPMRSWQEAMPEGMLLASPASLSDPGGVDTLAAFQAAQQPDRHHQATGAETGAGAESGAGAEPRAGLPVPRETFVAYGTWFARRQIPELEELTVRAVTRPGAYYELALCDGSRAQARQVVVATGMQSFTYVPSLLATLPSRLCTHSSAHPDLAAFRDADVVVVGAGQSALESAALLHEAGARVTLIARTPQLRWQPDPQAGAPADTGAPAPAPGWADWFYSTRPNLFRLLPAARRVQLARSVWGPSGTHWLRSRVEGRFPALVGHQVRWAEPEPWGVRLGLQVAGTDVRELTADHVLAATGYRAELSRLTFLDRRLRFAVRTLAGTPEVGPDFQSSVPGLYFVGPAVAATFGPVMRSLLGADYAARTVTRRLSAGGGQRSRRSGGRCRIGGRGRLTAAGSRRPGR